MSNLTKLWVSGNVVFLIGFNSVLIRTLPGPSWDEYLYQKLFYHCKKLIVNKTKMRLLVQIVNSLNYLAIEPVFIKFLFKALPLKEKKILWMVAFYYLYLTCSPWALNSEISGYRKKKVTINSKITPCLTPFWQKLYILLFLWLSVTLNNLR